MQSFDDQVLSKSPQAEVNSTNQNKDSSVATSDNFSSVRSLAVSFCFEERGVGCEYSPVAEPLVLIYKDFTL